MVNTVERNVSAVLEEKLEIVEKNFLAYADHKYDKDSKESVAQEIKLRSFVYTSLTILGEVIKDASSEFEKVNKRRQAHYKRANEYLNRTIEAEKKIKELTMEKEQLEEKLKKLRARVNTPDPFMIRVDGLGPNSGFIIRHAEAMVNERLNHVGFVTLADVYEELGLDKPDSPIAVVCGWRSEYSDAIHFDVYGHEEEDKYIIVLDDYRPIL